MNKNLEQKSQVLSNIDIFKSIESWRIMNACIFNTMRILKRVNQADTYIDNYLWHFHKRKDTFMDSYHLMWWIGSNWVGPKNILEIGCRTGISICQLLSSIMKYDDKKIVLFDIFNDGFLSPELVTMNLKVLNIPTNNIEFRVGDSQSTVPKFKEENPDLKFDYILVDGNHDKKAAKQDLQNVHDMLNPGGYLLFDDITPDGCGLQDVWDDFKLNEGFDFFENHDGKGLGWAIKKA